MFYVFHNFHLTQDGVCQHAGPVPGAGDDGDYGGHGDQPGPGHAAQEETDHEAQTEADSSGGDTRY